VLQLKSGSGPRHLAFSNSGRTLYVINEIECAVIVLSVDTKTGALRLLRTIPTVEDEVQLPSDAAEIALHPNSRFLYASTPRTSTIRLYRIEIASGYLVLLATMRPVEKGLRCCHCSIRAMDNRRKSEFWNHRRLPNRPFLLVI
jgi:6-phosphogluconolactonase